jgi:hypothetical protein
MRDQINLSAGFANGPGWAGRSVWLAAVLAVALCIPLFRAIAQTTTPPDGASGADRTTLQPMQSAGPDQAAPPITVTLQDALGRAQKNDAQYLATVGDAKSAHEDAPQQPVEILPILPAQASSKL